MFIGGRVIDRHLPRGIIALPLTILALKIGLGGRRPMADQLPGRIGKSI